MASANQHASDSVHGRGDPGNLKGNRRGDLSVGSVHHLQNVRGGQRVEEPGFRVGLFGQQIVEHGQEADLRPLRTIVLRGAGQSRRGLWRRAGQTKERPIAGAP